MPIPMINSLTEKPATDLPVTPEPIVAPVTEKSLKIKLNQLEMQGEELETKYKKVNGRYISAEIAFGIGLVGLLFLNFLWPLWAFLIIIGLLTWISCVGARKDLSCEMEQNKINVHQTRNDLINLE